MNDIQYKKENKAYREDETSSLQIKIQHTQKVGQKFRKRQQPYHAAHLWEATICRNAVNVN